MLGTGELIVILCLVLLLFGGKKLPELARNLGHGVREFRRAFQGQEEHTTPTESDCGSCTEKKCCQAPKDPQP